MNPGNDGLSEHLHAPGVLAQRRPGVNPGNDVTAVVGAWMTIGRSTKAGGEPRQRLCAQPLSAMALWALNEGRG